MIGASVRTWKLQSLNFMIRHIFFDLCNVDRGSTADTSTCPHRAFNARRETYSLLEYELHLQKQVKVERWLAPPP